jgi:hypothetical protein
MDNKLKNGLVLLQSNPNIAICLDENSEYYGWLFYQHPDGQYVTMRKLKSWELMQAEDQIDEGLILDGKKKEPVSEGKR